MSEDSAEAKLYAALIAWLLRTGVRPLREAEWGNFAAGLLCADPLSTHEQAAELLRRIGVLQLAEGANTEWGPFMLVVPTSDLEPFTTARFSIGPTLDELLAAFFSMCAHCVGYPKVQKELDPRGCHVDDDLLKRLIAAGYLERNAHGYSWTHKMISAMIAADQWGEE